MAFTDYIISDAEKNAAHVEAQPDVLRGSAQDNKKAFDKYCDLIRTKHNGLCNEVAGAVETVIDPTVLALFVADGWVSE